MEGKEDSATEKIARLEAAGIPVVERIDEIPDAVKAEAGGGVMPASSSTSSSSDEAEGDAELAQKLSDACPVDIFAATDGGTEIVEDNLDECILCGLCVDAAPAGAVVVKKLYDGTALKR